jgi:hypothetical protein
MDSAIDGERHDLSFERPAVGGRSGLGVALDREGVERGAVEAIFVDHHFRAGELAELRNAITVLDCVAPRPRADSGLHCKDRRDPHRHARHAFDTRSDDYVLRARHYRLGREMERLL